MIVCVLMGEPGTGKTTVMRAFMKAADVSDKPMILPDYKLVPFHISAKNKLAVLGKYEEGEIYAGTDRMSMAVQPEAIKFMEKCKSSGMVDSVVFEGDRLTNQSFLEFCLNNFDTSIIYLDVDATERQKRYEKRGSNQSEQFIRGRVTKYSNLMGNFDIMMAVQKLSHSVEEDTVNVVNHMMEIVKA
jgi:hypothetical protein